MTSLSEQEKMENTITTTTLLLRFNTNTLYNTTPPFHHPHDQYDHNIPYPLLKQPLSMIFVYSVAYLLIFIGALVGNSMVVIVVVRIPHMRSVTNFLIANLAVADILVAVFCIPITLVSNIFSGWPFGAFLCKSTPYLQGVSVCASVYTLAAIALDRYLAICRPPRWRMSGVVCRLLIIFIWTLAAGLLVPWVLYYEQFPAPQEGGLNMCHQLWPDYLSQRAYYVGAIFVGTYAFPLLVVLVCYICIGVRVWTRNAPGVAKNHDVIRRCRLKVVKMLAVMVSLFALSWLPLHVIYMYLYFPGSSRPDERHLEAVYSVAVPVAQWLELSNSGINPLVYCFFSNNFRREFRNLCCVRQPLRRRRKRAPSGLYSGGSTSKFMTMDYVNGHVTITFRKELNKTESCSEV